MHDSKDNSWRDDFNVDSDSASEADKDVVVHDSGNDRKDGWDQYRRWISKAPAPRKRRTGLDPSLYTWKGYRNWTEQVKRNWTDNGG